MKNAVEAAAACIVAVRQAYARKWIFLVVFAFIFLSTLAVLSSLDLLPNPLPPKPPVVTLAASSVHTEEKVAVVEFPEWIEIPSIGVSAPVANPSSTETAILDSELGKGAVRYPTSAKLGEKGNVVLFGHSSYLPVVRNPAYKTFNGIQKLKNGQHITVYSSHTVYVYSVKSVRKEKAEEGAIPLSIAGKQLTLATCDSFGEKSDRFVVVADFVESHPIAGS